MMTFATTIAVILAAGLPATAAMAAEPAVPTVAEVGASVAYYDDYDRLPNPYEYPEPEWVHCINGAC